MVTMVVLGVGLFLGIPMACDNAFLSAGGFYDSVNMFDIRVVSTLGLSDADADAIASVDGVSAVFAGFSKNVKTNVRDKDVRVSVAAMDENGMNAPHVLEGSLPEAGGEIAVTRDYLRASGKNLGDSVVLNESSDADDSAAEADETDDEFGISVEKEKTHNLVYREYVITAAVLSPMNTSTAFNDSTGGAAYLFYVSRDSIVSDIYTEIYAAVEGASGLNCYGEAYKALVRSVMDDMDYGIKEMRLEARYADVQGEAFELIRDAENELDVKKADAEKELRDGAQKLADARIEIEDAVEEVADGWKTIAKNRIKLADAAAEIEKGEAELADALAKLQRGKAEYEDGLALYNKETRKLKDLQQGIAAIPDMIAYLGSMLPEPQDVGGFIGAAGGVIRSANGAAALMSMGDVQAKTAASAIETITGGASAALEAGAWQTAAELLGQLTYFQEGMEQTAQTASSRAAAEGAKLKAAKKSLDEGFAAYYEGADRLAGAKDEILDGWREIRKAEIKLKDAETELEDAKAELADGEREYYENLEEYNSKIEEADQKLADAKTDVEEIAYPKWYILDRSSVDSFERLKNDVSSIRAVGSAFPIIFLIVAVSVCLTSMTRLVEEERSVVGTYMALGYSGGAITMKYVVFAVIACAIGGVLGSLLGFFFFPWAIWEIIALLHALPVRSFDLNLGFAALAVFIYAAALTTATVIACRREIRRKPSELMRPKPPKSGARILLERFTPLWNRFKFLSKVTARNLFRYKKRMFMTVFGVTGCTALIVTGFALKNSALDLVAAQYNSVTVYDMIAVFDPDKENAEWAVTDYLNSSAAESFTGVMINGVTLLNAERESLGIQLVATDAPDEFENYVRLTDESTMKSISMPDAGVVVTENAAKVLGLKAGDAAVLRDADNAEHEIMLEAVVHNYLGNFIYCPLSYYVSLFGEASPNAFLIKTPPGLDADGKAELRRELADEKDVLNVTNIESVKRSFTESMAAVDSVVYILIAMAACLALVVLYTLANINISERRRELATIKVLGFFDREMNVYVSRETFVLAAAGIALGLPAGRGIGEFIVSTIKMPSISIHIAILPVSYAAAAALTIAFTLIISLLTNRTLRRLDMIESLKSVE